MARGRNRCGTVVIQEQQIFAAREVAKVDARPGGYVATGGHGGIIGQISHSDRLVLTYVPVFKHTYLSDVNLTKLPTATTAVRNGGSGIQQIEVAVKDPQGRLLPDAIPAVSIVKDGSYSGIEIGDDPLHELDLIAAIDHKLSMGRLAGFIAEGLVPYGSGASEAREKLLLKALFSGIPVARVGRGAPEGFADRRAFYLAGANLTATKARLLLMACLLRFGSLPPAKDPDNPTSDELGAIERALATYQEVFDTH